MTSRLSQLGVEERQFAFTETCPEFTKLFLEVLHRHQDYGGRSIISVVPQSTSISIGVDQQESGKQEKISSQPESLLYASVRLYSKETYLDSITVCHKFLENVEQIMECFSTLSASQCFLHHSSTTSKQQSFHKSGKSSCTDHTKSKLVLYDNFPQWFKLGTGGTIYQWISAFFEQTLLNKYGQICRR